MDSLRPNEAPTIASPPFAARKTRSERFLREQLFFGDLAAISLAWGLPMLYQSQLRPDRSVAAWLAAAVSTLAMIRYAGCIGPGWALSSPARRPG